MKFSRRWLPAVIIPSLVAAGAIALPIQANAVDLPDLTPQQLLVLMDGDISAFSGVVVKSSDLGLPPLEMSSMMDEEMIKEMEEKLPEGFEDFVPSLIEQNAITQAVELIAGVHRVRVYSSEVGVRIQILDPMSQRDLIVNKEEFWMYDARNATALTGKIDDEVSESDKSAAEEKLRVKLDEYLNQLQLDISNPEEVASYLLEKLDASTEISVGKDHRIAGRTAYQLIAKPRSEVSLIESIVVSVDSETGMALDVSVYSTEQEQVAFQVGFESISFETPDPNLFTFVAPPGTTVEEFEAPEDLKAELENLESELETEALSEEELLELKEELEAKYADLPRPELIGEGWESVMYLPAIPEEVPMGLLENELFADLMIPVDGGKVFSTPVLNVLVTDSGEVYFGSVTIEFLRQVAAR